MRPLQRKRSRKSSIGVCEEIEKRRSGRQRAVVRAIERTIEKVIERKVTGLAANRGEED